MGDESIYIYCTLRGSSRVASTSKYGRCRYFGVMLFIEVFTYVLNEVMVLISFIFLKVLRRPSLLGASDPIIEEEA